MLHGTILHRLPNCHDNLRGSGLGKNAAICCASQLVGWVNCRSTDSAMHILYQHHVEIP